MTRRGALAAAVLAGVAGLSLSSASDLLEQFAPLSGDAWNAADRERPERVESPYGDATVRIDDEGVPHVEADDERAAYFAIGHLHGFDRGFQLDLQRRQMRGELSSVVGEATLESDEFHVRMDFAGAAEATWNALEETHAGSLVEAYADGVNAAFEGTTFPLEFELLEFEPDPWVPADTLLMEKQIAWTLTGNFSALRRQVLEDRLEPAILEALFPERMDHDTPVLRTDPEHVDGLGELRGVRIGESGASEGSDETGTESTADAHDSSTPSLATWLSRFESPPGVGSNSWVVSGEHTESGTPIVANDPHLQLMTPPLWYEQHVETAETSVRGVTFPGVPFVIIGANEAAGWGFTNVGADVLDCYTYQIDDENERYRYRSEWREFETEEREIAVSGGENRTITARKTVHGPLLEREGETVGVAWTGLSATRTTEAVYDLTVSEGVDDALEAARRFDVPTQNLVYADANGRTLYVAAGQFPIRRDGDDSSGEPIAGNRVFDGSAGEGEWEGYEPYGVSDWEGDGFVPFEEQPAAIDPDLLATANQRTADDPEHYVGTAFAMPYRGRRIYDELDAAAGEERGTDLEFHRTLQTDRRDERAVDTVPDLLEAGTAALEDGTVDDPDQFEDAIDTLEDWGPEYEMVRDSRGALLFARWFEHLRAGVLEPVFDPADLGSEYYSNDWIVATLPAENPVFEDRSRDSILVEALETTLVELEDEGWDTYGDWNTTEPVAHPFGSEAPFLSYDERPTDGSRATVDNYRVESAVGASWRMVVEPGGEAWAILPGGNSGDYFSPHYDDQFERWADGEYKSMDLEASGETATRFEGVER
ncbi:penicillin acylase family protein [Natronosalvus caseinilyticus]|uniref:penicillin acylase family protein n=1 Tax=Natronosalvus caseinilyticus TaxID=2953747 RepID=UPI0028A86F75|nr:penicillin acylase family protein [Natronosalvus caseinilyticus]